MPMSFPAILKRPCFLVMVVFVLTMAAPVFSEIVSFQQGTNGYDRGQDTAIRWAYSVNFGDTSEIDHIHPGDNGAYEMRNTNGGRSAILEVGNFYQRDLGAVGGGISSPEAGPTYRYSRMMIRFRDVLGTASGQVSPDSPIKKATLKLYNTHDLGALATAGGGAYSDPTAGPMGTQYPNPQAEPKLNEGKISIFPLMTPIKYGKSDGAAAKGEVTAEWKRRERELWSTIINKGLWEDKNNPLIAQFLGPRELNDPYVGQQVDVPYDNTVTPGVTGEYDASHPGAVEVFQDATEEFKEFDVTGLIDFITGDGVFLTVLIPDESELPSMARNFGNAYRSNDYGDVYNRDGDLVSSASAEDIATRPILVIELGDSVMPGDANGDGIVDVADLGVLGANFGGTNAVSTDGDFNGDGVIDVADLGILGANWTAGQEAGAMAPLVPEPATLSLLAMSVLLVGCRRR